jgi:3,4-dihydroxy-2-butanone 4-phosphate synthase
MVMDSDDREDECDLIIAAEHVTAPKMAWLIRETTGIICVVSDKARLEGFGLHPATDKNTDVNGTNFYVSTDFIPGTTTGVSAADRTATVHAFCDSSHPPEAFSKPGHMFPLCARPGGVLERPGHTESSYDLCRLAGVKPVGVIGELMHNDGTMFRRQDSLEFSAKHKIPIITVDALIAYRKANPLPPSARERDLLEIGKAQALPPSSRL